jgi:hypothetical protein
MSPKKARTPPPPRRVQAPKVRTQPRDPRNRRLILLGAAGAVVVVAAAVAIALFVVGGGSSGDAVLRDAGCTIEKAPAQDRAHVEQLEEDFEYNLSPPATGPHNPIPAPWDVYTEPVEQFRLVHNLEHGGVIIQYGEDVPQSTVDQIVDWYRDDPNGIVIAPLPELDDQIALAAWVTPDADPEAAGEGVVAKCPRFDEAAFDTFLDTYGFRGPERFPRGDLQPGT